MASYVCCVHKTKRPRGSLVCSHIVKSDIRTVKILQLHLTPNPLSGRGCMGASGARGVSVPFSKAGYDYGYTKQRIVGGLWHSSRQGKKLDRSHKNECKHTTRTCRRYRR